MDRLLGKISSNQPIMLLPLRIETKFRRGKFPAYPKPGGIVKPDVIEFREELCVRIFPDEFFLDYNRTTMTEKEFDDGRRFWIQWFIASGSPKREYEAWQVLCKEYSPGHAAWIARMTRIEDLDLYRRGDGEDTSDGALFYRRPYTRLTETDDACDSIYENLSEFILGKESIADLGIDPETGEYNLEKELRKRLSAIRDNLYEIDRDLMACEYVVDYLYDKIDDALLYLSRRLDSFRSFYDLYPSLVASNTRTLEAWDMDFAILKSLQDETLRLREKLTGKRIPLDDLIQNYLSDPKNDVFSYKGKFEEDKMLPPKVSLLPDRFVLIAEPMDKNKPKRVCYGNPVNHSIKMVPDPGTLSETVIDKDGTMHLDRSLLWMSDYEQAYADGMAISLPLEKDDTAFRYIYVLGVREPRKSDLKDLESLLNGHNYLDEGMAFVGKESPTNLVEGGAGSDVLSREEEMRIRFEIEVNDAWKKTEADSKEMADILHLSYSDCLGRIPLYDISEKARSRIANRALWNRVYRNLEGQEPYFKEFLDYVGDFLVDNVSATGPLPMLRIGNVPYGFLPVTDHEMVRSTLTGNQDFKLRLLYETLISLGNEWKRLRENSVVAAERLSGADAERDYLSMLGQTPRSLDIFEREMMDSPLLPDFEVPSIDGALKYLKNGQLFRPWPISDTARLSTLDDMKDCVREALEDNGFADIQDDELEALSCEFMDLFTHRLDAWFTGMAMQLHKNPEAEYLNPYQVTYPAIGAYGWVFNLKENRSSGGAQPDKGEYILAPSLEHATTAAVLRAAYLNTKKDDGDTHMCINLSSMRSRAALRMIDGIKNGLSTGVVLGADLERLLHEAHLTHGQEMDEFIYPLRKLFPQNINIEPANASGGRMEAANYMMQVINGELLLNTFFDKWTYDGRLSEWLKEHCMELDWYKALNDSGLPMSRKSTTLFLLIEQMYDAYDALNDLLLAEGVHRLVLGDDASFSAIAKFMSQGSGNLPDPAILDCPMDYAAFTQKTAVALPVNGKGNGYMGQAEPSLNAWLLEQIGGMDKILFDVTWQADADSQALTSQESLASLGVEPLEYLYLSGNSHALKTLLEYRWRCRESSFRGIVKILTGDPSENGPFEVSVHRDAPYFSLYEDSMRIDTLRSLLSHSRPMTVSDWNSQIVSDIDLENSVDKGDLQSRYLNLYSGLNLLSREMGLVLDNYREDVGLTDEELAQVLSLQSSCIASGLVEAAADYPAGLSLKDVDKVRYRVEYDEILESQKRFMEQFSSIRDALCRRLADAAGLIPVANGSPATVSQYQKVFSILTTKPFKVVPHFTPHEYLDSEWTKPFASAIRDTCLYYDLEEDRIYDWLTEVAPAHPSVKEWLRFVQFQEMADMDEIKPVILQKRYKAENTTCWMGLPCDEDKLDDADSLVIYGKKYMPALTPSSQYACLVFDSWMEYIPYSSHIAGMVFRCDQPDAEAPQTILLAEFPELGVTSRTCWDSQHILQILDSTRFQIMNRAVDPDMIYHDERLSRLFPLISDARLFMEDVNFVYTSFVDDRVIRNKLKTAVQLGIFDYMPGGEILKEFLDREKYE